jgi:predicted RNA-binding protein with PIN domain
MPIIIDGWNLIRDERSDIDDTDMDAPDGALLLIRQLERFQKSHNDPIFLVFDSAREFLDTGYENTIKVHVVATKNADSYIKRYIDKTPERQRRNLRVVSSDKEIFFYAKSACAEPLLSRDFWAKLRREKHVSR